MKRLLITGASGFVGRAMLQSLQGSDWEIHSVSRVSNTSKDAEWHRADAKNSQAMQALIEAIRPTHLLHLAWYTNPKTFWNSPENREWLRATIELFDLFKKLGGERIVGVGSCAEYDWTSGICHEQRTLCRPSTIYGQSKLAAANHLATLGRQGLSTTWARLFFMYGPGASDARIPGAVITALSRSESALCSAGGQRRDFLYIDDVASALVAVLESDLTGPVNICSGEAISIGGMAKQTAELMGKKKLLLLGALPAREDDPPLIIGDNTRLRSLGWKPQFTLEEGLRSTIVAWPHGRASSAVA